MLKVREAIGITAALSVSACSGVGLGDQFDYSTKSDEFTGAKITEASATVAGDVDKNASLTVVLRCKYPASEQPDPFKHTTIEFSLVDPKGDPKDFSDLTVKFDDTRPTNARFLEQNDTSKYSNVSEQYYSNMAVVMVPADERIRALYARNQENAYRLINLAIHARSIMVRYETAGGMVNTNTLSIDGANYRKVLEDCGWQKWVKNYEETRTQATGIASPAPAPSTVAANAPANQSNGIPANRLADGVWDCTASGEKFAIQITDHRRDTNGRSIMPQCPTSAGYVIKPRSIRFSALLAKRSGWSSGFSDTSITYDILITSKSSRLYRGMRCGEHGWTTSSWLGGQVHNSSCEASVLPTKRLRCP